MTAGTPCVPDSKPNWLLCSQGYYEWFVYVNGQCQCRPSGPDFLTAPDY